MPRRLTRRATLAALTLSLCACGTLPNGRAFGEDATLWPGRRSARDATLDAWRDPWTWAPLAGAAVLMIGKWDEEIAEWANEHTPLYGSPRDAERWSDDLWTGLQHASVVSTLATPGGADPGTFLDSKARSFLVREAASEARSLATTRLKHGFQRPRFDGTDNLSFPSGHTSAAFNHAAWTARNLEFIPMDDDLRVGLQWTAYTAAAGTAWARVEAGRHYPVDVLAGAALGNFLARFFHGAFLGLEDPDTPRLSVSAARDGFLVGLRWSF